MPRAALTLGAIAAVMGAAGVALAAAAAHGGGGSLAETGALFLIIHAAALLGLIGAVNSAAPEKAGRAILVGGFGLAAAASLFSADLASRGLAGDRLFPFAAPVGGTGMIFSWLFIAAIFAWRALSRR
jgi:uncharacterized membrane protein YgdD (TMEM256/DUF423 family)